MRIVNIVGARPQFIKAGPVSKALAEAGIEELLVHTGQHYDPVMSEEVMRDIGLRNPDVNLGVGSGSHGVQTGRMVEAIERLLIDKPAESVIVYGDTNSTIAAALAAAKLHVPTAHIEAGLRSWNRRMPEEVNRVVTDHVADHLYAPTETAMNNLAAEGLGERSVLSGDVMLDAIQSLDVDTVRIPDWASGDFYIATIHRAENTDDATLLKSIVDSMTALPKVVHLLAHPRLRARLAAAGLGEAGNLHIHEPLPYAEMIVTARHSSGILTDSGGLQKEAFMMKVPCITLRTETEWPETLEGGWNVMVEPGAPLEGLFDRPTSDARSEPFGDGKAALRIVGHLKQVIA